MSLAMYLCWGSSPLLHHVCMYVCMYHLCTRATPLLYGAFVLFSCVDQLNTELHLNVQLLPFLVLAVS